MPLRSQPGTEWRYSVGMDLAGLVVQRLAGQRFDRYLKEHLFEPLDMRDTGFVIPDEKRGVGVLTDPVARGVSGNAGEFYHDGAAGTVFWVDPVEDIVGLGMIQVMGGFVWEPDLKTAVYQAATESKR